MYSSNNASVFNNFIKNSPQGKESMLSSPIPLKQKKKEKKEKAFMLI